MREGIRLLAPDTAVFAMIGDPRSVEVNRHVGYVPTHVPKIYSFWVKDLPEEERRNITDRVASIGAF
jgi:hypothetical protein